MSHFARKTTPGVAGGRPLKKNNWRPTPTYYNTPQVTPAIDRRRPGAGHRHFLLRQHIIDFISIIPEWDELSRGLNAIVLDTHDDECDGWHQRGVVAICAWNRDEWVELLPWYYTEHKDIFRDLGVPCAQVAGGNWLCKFNAGTIRAYQLLHIFLHELGHHHDRMSTRSRRETARGESYAERYARERGRLVWDRYEALYGFE